MLLILSPAKTYHATFKQLNVKSEMLFPQETAVILNELKQYTQEELKSLMKLSDPLAELTKKRYENFESLEEVSAIYAFDGEVYRGLSAHTLSEEAISFACQHLVILSGLYGMLTPTTLMKPYRLEMGLSFAVQDDKKLTAFWKDRLTQAMIARLDEDSGEKVLLNLASAEYTKALDLKKIRQHFRVVDVAFKEQKGETYKVVGMYAKKARGQLTRFILEHQLTHVDEIKTFNEDGYTYHPELSTENSIVFTR